MDDATREFLEEYVRAVTDTRCYRCGYCCRRGTCVYGRWDRQQKQCAFLTPDNLCAKYDEIVANESGSKYPMFGCGCSSTLFNEARDAKRASSPERTVS